MNTKFKQLTLAASLIACGLVAAGNAQAEAYAYAYNNIFNLGIVDNPNASNFLITDTSSTAASLTGFPGCSTSSGTDATACNINTPGAVKAENDMTPYGNVAGSTYARGDAQIVAVGDVSLGQAWNVAESRIDGQGTGVGGSSNNSSQTSLVYVFNVGDPAGVSLSIFFNADPYLQAVLDTNARAGSYARAILAVSATITDSLGNTVFSWAPDGIVGNVGGSVGGTEIADPTSLNRTLSRDPLLNGSVTFDPTGDASNGVLTPGASVYYQADTNVLAYGSYTLNLNMSERTEVNRVPEPASLALLGLGLLGMAGVARRKRS